jgi:glutathione S-transferase
MTPVLVTIPISHFCEKARFALLRAGIGYREAPHGALFHLAHTIPRGGRTTPILELADGTMLTHSHAILLWVDAQAGGDFLYPRDEALKAEVIALEKRFDHAIGPHVRRWGYGDVLGHPDIVVPLLTHGVPTYERVITRGAFPLVRSLMKRGMGIDARGVARSREKLATFFGDESAALIEGKRFLVGDRFTAADLTLAALTAPLFGPSNYGIPVPASLFRSDAHREDAARWKTHPLVRHAMRMYATEKRCVA